MLEHKEVIDTVEAINQMLFDKSGEVELGLEYHTNGFAQNVLFGEQCLWSSEDDTRRYDEPSDSYEPLEDCLRRELSECVAKFAAIKDLL